MDIHETLSDCSESSRGSEYYLSSNTSTLSNLSHYGEEFLEIKKTINQEPRITNYKLKSDVFSISSSHRNYMQDEPHKDILDVERKLTLSYNEKIEKLLQRNIQLEENLKAANDHIQRLINICCQKNHHDSIRFLEEKILNLEKSNHDLNFQNSTISNELNKINCQKRELESDYKNLKTHYNELKLQLAAKEKCVVELKDKVLEQHLDLQKALQNNVKISHTVNSLSNELQHMTKSENWYKKELNRVQKEKGDLTIEIAKKSKIIANQDEKHEQLSLELNKCKCKYDEVCLTLLKEKENISKQFETEAKLLTRNDPLQITSYSANLDFQSITHHYEMTIKELTNEVLNIKMNFKNQQNSLDELTKQNSEMLVKCAALENLLKEKNNIIDKLECDEKDLKLKLDIALNKELEHKTNLLHLKSVITRLETELTMKIEEKAGIEETVRKIKEQFQLLKSKYRNLKDELSVKDKELVQIQLQNQDLLSNNNNQKTSVQEKYQQTDNAINDVKEKESECIINNNESQKKPNELEARQLNAAEHFHNTYPITEFENYTKADKVSALRPEQKELEDTYFYSANYKCVNDNVTSFNKDKELITVEPFNADIVQKNVKNFVVNNYANLEPHNTAYIVMEYICKLCKIDDYPSILQKNFYSKTDNSSESINELFNKINKYFNFDESLQKDNKISNINKKVMKLKSFLNKIGRLEEKCKILEHKTEENEGILLKLLKQGSGEEKVKHLQALLEVKIREQRDKQKRYEINYRTLLRKVKEHMKGRNVAEKRSLYLQELYDNLSDECNSLKLQIHLKNSEIDELKGSVENQNNNYKRIKPCENELALSRQCDKCVELELTKNKELEEMLKSWEYFKETLFQETKVKEELVTALRTENQELLFKLSVLDNELKCTVVKIENLLNDNKQLTEELNNRENMLLEAKSISEKLEAELSIEKDAHFRVRMENENLTKQLEELTNRNAYFMKDIEFINSCLQQKDEELKELNLRKKELESTWEKKDNNMQNIIMVLKSQLQIFKNEMGGIRNEKFFLQRLCNDLKAALKIHVHQNKVFQEHIFSMSEEKQKWSEYFASDFPCPSKHDDYIERLLQANSAPIEETLLSDVQGCLDGLRKEINILQKQIIEKNIG